MLGRRYRRVDGAANRAGQGEAQTTLFLFKGFITTTDILTRIDLYAISRHRQVLIRNHVRAADMRLAAGHDIHVATGRANGADALALGGAVFVQLMT
ncbi:hypothetical protein D3C73_1382780 [compost metagenome]